MVNFLSKAIIVLTLKVSYYHVNMKINSIDNKITIHFLRPYYFIQHGLACMPIDRLSLAYEYI